MKHDYLAQKIRNCRLACKLTQQQIAKILNVDRSTYTYYETGKTTPDIHTLKILSGIFNLTIEELMDDDSTVLFRDSAGGVGDDPTPQADIAQRSMAELSPQEREMVAFFRTVPQNKQALLIEQARKLSCENDDGKKTPGTV